MYLHYLTFELIYTVCIIPIIFVLYFGYDKMGTINYQLNFEAEILIFLLI